MGLSSNSFSVSDFYSTKSLSIKRRCSLSTDPPIITQKPRVQASPLLHSPPETLSVRGRDIIAAFIQWPSSIESQPHWSQWTLGFNREVHWRYGNVEKQIESAEQLYVADSEPTRLRDERVRTHFNFNTIVHIWPLIVWHYRGSRASLAVLKKSPLLDIDIYLIIPYVINIKKTTHTDKHHWRCVRKRWWELSALVFKD